MRRAVTCGACKAGRRSSSRRAFRGYSRRETFGAGRLSGAHQQSAKVRWPSASFMRPSTWPRRRRMFLHRRNERCMMNTRLLVTLRVSVAPPRNIGAVPHGIRRTVPITAGEFEGPRLRGSVLPGGSADWLLLRADGVLELDLRAALRTDDGALISMKSFGLRHGPPEVIEAM